MGFLDKIFGGGQQQPPQFAQPGATGGQGGARPAMSTDEQAVARYKYMLQTAPPEQLEQAHQEAFARLTPEQRQLALRQLSQVTPHEEQQFLSDDPHSMARAATRAEMRQPGALQQAFGGGGMMGGGMGMGGMMMGGLLTSLAGGFIGSSIANSFFSHGNNEQGFQQDMASGGFGGDGGGYDGDASFANAPDLTSADDPFGDPGAMDSGGFDAGGFDAGGFDAGGFDAGGGDFGGDF